MNVIQPDPTPNDLAWMRHANRMMEAIEQINNTRGHGKNMLPDHVMFEIMCMWWEVK